MTFNEMVNAYNNASYTHNYIFGFSYKGTVYYTYRTSEILAKILITDTASRGDGMSIKYRPNNEIRKMLLENAVVLCDTATLENEVATTKYNRGEIFEKYITEKFGQTWTKDHVPFTEDGDITVDGIAYQIKYEKATFCSEKTLMRLGIA